MSKNIVDVAIEYSNSSSIPITFIPSRRQVEYNGGYVNNWTTKEFVEYVKERSNSIHVERDHGGPGQGNVDDDGMESFKEDCKYMDVIHIDPWKKYPHYNDGLKETIKAINFCYNENPNIIFEIATEEGIRKFEVDELENLILDLQKSLKPEIYKQIKYLVVQCGTGLLEANNNGLYDKERLKNMISLCKKYGFTSKEHNGDWVTINLMKEKLNLGLDYINVAPELGEIETKTILNDINKIKDENLKTTLFNKFYDLCLKSKKWVKWVTKDFKPEENKEKLIMICGHYVFSDPEFLDIKNEIPNIDEKIKKELLIKLREYYDINEIIFEKKDNLKNNSFINNEKVVFKPWGKEVWLELNEKFCYKRIYINKGFKTSFQYHNFKLETNFIIDGEAEVWLENEKGVIEQFNMKSGDHFTVLPPRKHRVIAKTDIILQEVSTPDVDDVIRINDEFNRNNGRIEEEHKNPVVCILAAGTGSRLGNLSKNCHKSLLPIKNKAILTNIIDKFDKNHEIYIAVGHLKEQVIEYVNLYHSDRNIKFINIDKYTGKGSGPAYSLNCCKKELQRPFYFCVSDFYTNESIQNLTFSTKNWISAYDTNMSELYATIEMENGKIINMKNKSPEGYSKAFTGIFYMYDYELFWKEFDKYVDENYEIIDIFKNIKLFNFSIREFLLDDMGTSDLYFKLIEKYEGKNLHLHKIKYEHKYLLNDIFIKSGTEDKIENLFKRGYYLNELIPNLLFKGKHFFTYKYEKGTTLYEKNNYNVYCNFIDWFELNIVKSVKSNIDLKTPSLNFYKNKTYNRLNLIKSSHYFEELNSKKMINGVSVKTIDEYLNKIDWDNLTDILPITHFHGDLQFDNIIYNDNNETNENKFKYIDWREDFGGNVEYGDLYYDISKLYGGILLNYMKMKNRENYSFIDSGDSITLTSYCDDKLQNVLTNKFLPMLNRNNLIFNKVKLITALIYLNMCPLHINEFDKFLFLKSKLLFSEVTK